MSLILAILLNNLAPNAVPAEALAITIMESANRHSVDPVLLARIIIVESNGVEKARNSLTKDYGIAQINENTAKAMNVSDKCLMNYKCNIDVAARLIASIPKFRPCTYNLGPKGKLKKHEVKCLAYERKISSI